MSKVADTLKERGEKYGDFAGYALCASELNGELEHRAIANGNLKPIHIEALRMINSKIARILNGDPNHIDNWHDIAGYATLVEQELRGRSSETQK